MVCLLAVLGDVEQDECKYTKLLSLADFHVLAATAEAESYIDDKIATDSIFCTKAAQIKYDTFIGTALDEEQMT